MIHFVTMLLLLITLTYMTGMIAERRGRRVKTWYWMAAIFGPFALLAVAVLPRKDELGR